MISNNDYRMTRLSCIQYIKNTENINEVWNDVKGIYYQRPVNRTSSVYFDIDGTLAYFYRDGKGLTYEEMFEPENHYFRNLEPHTYMIKLAENLSLTEDVCVISSADIRTVEDKYEWIKEYAPFIKDDNIFFCPLGADKTRFIKNNAVCSVLIDDYNHNLDMWQQSGGICVKAVNSINSPSDRYYNLYHSDKEKYISKYDNGNNEYIRDSLNDDTKLIQELLCNKKTDNNN